MKFDKLVLLLLLVFAFASCNKSENNIENLPSACTHFLAYFDPVSTYRLIVPTAFTPNGDGRNDIARPLGLNLNNVTYSVARLNGELLYESINPFIEGWNGMDAMGNLATDPLYQIRIRFNSGQRYIDTCTYLYLLTGGTTPGDCVHYGTADTSKLIFEDEIDQATATAPYTTGEKLCP